MLLVGTAKKLENMQVVNTNTERKDDMNKKEALKIVLDFVERWNKQDEDQEVAEAASLLESEE